MLTLLSEYHVIILCCIVQVLLYSQYIINIPVICNNDGIFPVIIVINFYLSAFLDFFFLQVITYYVAFFSDLTGYNS